MDSWMKRLALHYESVRSAYPDDRLIVLFDIDGTILDMRQFVLSNLKSYDQNHGTRYFENLELSDINVHETHVNRLMSDMGLPDDVVETIRAWFVENQWTATDILESHRPFSGVMEVMRWFQIQPKTYLGVNTGRSNAMRAETLQSLNLLGKEYKVSFTDGLLYMNLQEPGMRVENSKAAGIRYFQDAGFRVVAFIDNEPANLQSVAEADPDGEIMLLHADTIFQSARQSLPDRSFGGSHYDINEFVHEKSLPRHVQLVWHGIDDNATFRQFLGSEVQWGEAAVHIDPDSGDCILRPYPSDREHARKPRERLKLDDILEPVKTFGKSLKLDFTQSESQIESVLDLVVTSGFDEAQLWFNGSVDVLGEDGFRRLSSEFSSSILQCPIDFMAPMFTSSPDEARDSLESLSEWGINRFSLDWETPDKGDILDLLDDWGFELNIYNVPDLESFISAVLLSPRSITSDFNFPKWRNSTG
jgi:hypothetical protein